MYNAMHMYDVTLVSSILYSIVFSKNYNSRIKFLIKQHVHTSEVICVLSIVQDNQRPTDVKGSTELGSTIAIFEQRKVCCF